MFYQTSEPCPLEIDPLKALVSPRPIGWISTQSADGIANLAPYSFFNLISTAPPMVMFSSSTRKDTLSNIEQTGEFVCNIAPERLKQSVVISSEPVDADTDEFELAELKKAPSVTVDAPRVAQAPAALECRLHQVIPLPQTPEANMNNFLVLGMVVGIHIDDGCLKDGRVDVSRFAPLMRLGYRDYSHIDKVYRL